MPDYVVFMKLTAQGAAAVDDLPDFTHRIRTAWETLGGSVRELLALMGEYDLLLVGSAESDEKAVAFALQLLSNGKATCVTHRAFTMPEMDQYLLVARRPPRALD